GRIVNLALPGRRQESLCSGTVLAGRSVSRSASEAPAVELRQEEGGGGLSTPPLRVSLREESLGLGRGERAVPEDEVLEPSEDARADRVGTDVEDRLPLLRRGEGLAVVAGLLLEGSELGEVSVGREDGSPDGLPALDELRFLLPEPLDGHAVLLDRLVRYPLDLATVEEQPCEGVVGAGALPVLAGRA